MNTLTRIPYWLCTLIVALFIFVISMYGTNVVRKVASTLSVLIIVGAISTGVNMIAGIVAHCVNAVEHRMKTQEEKGHMLRMAVATIIFTAIAWGIAQFGLMAVVKKGYSYLGYASLITVLITFIIHAIVTKMKEM